MCGGFQNITEKTKEKEVLPHWQQKQMITSEMIEKHIDRNIRRWVFAGCAERHLNKTWSGLRERLGTYGEDCKKVTFAASFLDSTDGEDTAEMISEALQAHADEILDWVQNGTATTLTLFCPEYPAEVAGITCSTFNRGNVEDSDGFIVILTKYGQPLFRLINVYPVRTTKTAHA